jgi:uncharacterized protein
VTKGPTAGTATGQKDGFLLGLLATFLLLIPLLAFLLWYLPSVGLVNIHPALPWVAGVLIGGVALLLVLGAGLLLLTLLTGRDLFLSNTIRKVVIKYFFPAILGSGRLLHLNTERLQHSFISLNNQLVEAAGMKVPADSILVLLPHCLQMADCPVKITEDVHKCQRCGKCDIMELLDLYEEKGVDLVVVTGGTLARKVLQERRPELIIAVACERDLISGICDAWPLPVLGLLNDRPHGPCFNTGVRVEAVKELLEEHIRD